MLEAPLDPTEPSLTAEAVDATLQRLAREHRKREQVLLRWLLRADELEVWRIHGYASIREYCERLFGFHGRGVADRLRVARALEQLPHLNAAFAAGDIVYSAARELTRVATPETERAWLEATAGETCTEVQRRVTGRGEGDLPTDPVDEDLVPKRVTLTLSTGALAALESAREKVVRDTGGHVDDSAFIQEVMLAYLAGGPGERDAGKAAYQIALTVDVHGRARTRGGGESVPVDTVTVEMAECDAQHIGVIDDGEAPRATQTIPPRVRRQVMARHEGRCAVPGCRCSAWAEVHHVTPRADGGRHDPETLMPLCGAHHRAVHDGALVVTGTWSSGFVFRHADGRPYGAPVAEGAPVAVMGDAFTALRGLGFRETQVRQMLDRVRADAPADLTLESVVRLALAQAPMPSGVREEIVGYQRCA